MTTKIHKIFTYSMLDKFIHFYYEQIFTHNKRSHILNAKIKKYFIIDYANIIHILYNKYKDVVIVSEKFNRFLEKCSKNIIFIVSKPVTIGDVIIDIDINPLPNVYIFNIEYKLQISSNIDDILTHFLCLVIFIGLLRLKVDPKNKIVLITNDKQNFCKNLFEMTEDEKKNRINLLTDIQITEISMGKRNKVKGIKKFLKEYITCEKKTNKTLKCNIGQMIKALQKEKMVDFNYDNLNGIQKKITNKCMTHSRVNGNLKKYFYLYVYIKYIQSYLNDDFYGSMSKEKIILLFK
jgi:translation initiation factor 2 beta subunit (eIF-2beta)/eIF-5